MRRRPEDFQAIRMLDKDTPIRQTQGKGGIRRNVNRAPLSSLRPESKYDTTDKELIQRFTMAERMSDALPDDKGPSVNAPASSKRPKDIIDQRFARFVQTNAEARKIMETGSRKAQQTLFKDWKTLNGLN